MGKGKTVSSTTPVVTTTPAATKLKDGVTYSYVATYHGKLVYGRLDTVTLSALKAARSTDLELCQALLDRQVILVPSSTGEDGIKCEGGDSWVIKVSFPTAKKNGIDCTISPHATAVAVSGEIYLDFNSLVKRH